MKIFLDGTSSAGKTSIASEIRDKAKFTVVSVDEATAEKWFPKKNEFSKGVSQVALQNQFMANMANNAKHVVIDDISMEILPLLKGIVYKVLVYTQPKDLVRNVKKRAKQDFRYIQVVMQQFSEKYMAGTSEYHVDWISGHDIRDALAERKSEFVNQTDMVNFARQVCDRMSIPYSNKKYYIRPVRNDYNIVINTRGMNPKKITDVIFQTILKTDGGGGRSTKSLAQPEKNTVRVLIMGRTPTDVNVSTKKSGHRISKASGRIKITLSKEDRGK